MIWEKERERLANIKYYDLTPSKGHKERSMASIKGTVVLKSIKAPVLRWKGK